MQIEYRLAKPEELVQVFQLVSAAIHTMESQNIYQWDEIYPNLKILEEDIQKKQLYVGMIENRIAVIYVLNQECDDAYENGNWKHKDKPFYVIHRLCVSPEFQNRGIAMQTMLYIEKKLQSMDIAAIRLDAYTQNPYSVRLYEKLGYDKVGFAEWRKGKFYLMEKYI